MRRSIARGVWQTDSPQQPVSLLREQRCFPPSLFPGKSREGSPRKGEKGGIYKIGNSAPRPYLQGMGTRFRSRGPKTLDSRVSLVAAAPPGRSEQNRLSPLPRVIVDAGISLVVL